MVCTKNCCANIFFHTVDHLCYHFRFGILGSYGKWKTAEAGVMWCELLHFPLVLMNRLNKIESAVFVYCRFSLFIKDPFSQII